MSEKICSINAGIYSVLIEEGVSQAESSFTRRFFLLDLRCANAALEASVISLFDD